MLAVSPGARGRGWAAVPLLSVLVLPPRRRLSAAAGVGCVRLRMDRIGGGGG